MPDVFVSKETEKHKKEKTDLRKSSHVMPSEETLRRSPGYRSNSLSAFRYYPKHINFLDKDYEEKIVLLVRKHPITNISWILLSILMLFAPLALTAVPLLSFLPQGANYTAVAILIWYLITLAFVFEQFLTWFFNVNIVTDERVIDVDFHNLLYREITSAGLDEIQDVTVRVGSAIRTLFNFGDVSIQTAGEVPEIQFEAVPNPDRISKILHDLSIEEEIEKIEGRVR